MPAKTVQPSVISEPTNDETPETPAAETTVRRFERKQVEGLGEIQVSFVDSLPATAPRGRGASDRWNTAIDACKANANKWAKLATLGSPAKPKALVNAGLECRLIPRMAEDVNGAQVKVFDLYAMFPGE